MWSLDIADALDLEPIDFVSVYVGHRVQKVNLLTVMTCFPSTLTSGARQAFTEAW